LLLTASWRLFQFSMHHNYPPVVRLQLHLPDQQMVLFDPEAQHILHQSNMHKTNLTEFFVACHKYPQAQALTYPQMAHHFVWNNRKKEWTLRQKGKAVGRVYFAGPAAGERYYLRMLLHTVKGPTSWEHLRTVNGIVHDSFKEACAALGLLETDDEYHKCLEEAATLQTGRQLRHLFAMILLECTPTSPLQLWSAHAHNLSDDCEWRLKQKHVANPTDEQVLSLALHDLNEILQQSGKSLQDFGLPLPASNIGHLYSKISRVIADEMSYNQQHLEKKWRTCLDASNQDQRAAFHTVIAAYESGRGGIFFVDGPGGTGKTFLENMILARVRSTGDIALAVASSGIAAILLDGGRTAHSRFKIPIKIHSDSYCSIKAQSDLAELIRQTKIVLWDEAPMHHRQVAEAVERTFQDIRNDERPFGGVVMVFAGKPLSINFTVFIFYFNIFY
jgi:hypothetical protein